LDLDCTVVVGYPEIDVSKQPAALAYYNSVIVINGKGETMANCRKSHLDYIDNAWAMKGRDGFYTGEIKGLGNVVMGICKPPTSYSSMRILLAG
jgi:protein N-terminal amidase